MACRIRQYFVTCLQTLDASPLPAIRAYRLEVERRLIQLRAELELQDLEVALRRRSLPRTEHQANEPTLTAIRAPQSKGSNYDS